MIEKNKGIVQTIAYCPHPCYEKKHAYLTSDLHKQGATWQCSEHSPKEVSEVQLNRMLERLFWGDLEYAIETNQPIEYLIQLKEAYEKAKKGEYKI